MCWVLSCILLFYSVWIKFESAQCLFSFISWCMSSVANQWFQNTLWSPPHHLPNMLLHVQHSFKKNKKNIFFVFLSFINFSEQETGKQVKSEHGRHEPKGLRTKPKPPHFPLRHVGARSTPQPKYPTPFILDLCSLFSCEILINWSVQLV